MRVSGFHSLAAAALALTLGGLSSSPAAAVERAPVKVPAQIAERWAVVGVIAGTDASGAAIGIAVLKNAATQRTYTVSLGDSVPTEFGFVLSAVHDRQVEISDGRSKVMLGFAEGSGSDEEDDADRTARFLDNYYRSLGGNRLEVLAGDESAETPPSDVDSGAVLPLKRFGSLKDEGDSRFELYSPDRTYRFGADGEILEGEEGALAEGEDGGSPAVSYDSFDDSEGGYAGSTDSVEAEVEAEIGATAVDAETGDPLE
jgi:hypothetical protein